MPSPDSASPQARPRLAALFWFYKAFDLCRERVELLRRFNPGLLVYGLYGGDPADGEAARAALGDRLDDLFLYEGPQDATWRWIHGDQVIAAWHAARGPTLAWDTLVVVQWDMLVLAPLQSMLAELRLGEAAFSGDRPLAEVAPWWGWGGIVGNAEQNRVMAEFRAWLSDRFGCDVPLWSCLFVVAALPRGFLDRYLAEGPPEPGFLEYKLPTLARMFGTPVRQVAALDAWWRADPATRDAPPAARAINATGDAVAPALMLAELADPQGRRAFHPVYEIAPEVLVAAQGDRP